MLATLRGGVWERISACRRKGRAFLVKIGLRCRDVRGRGGKEKSGLKCDP